MGKVTLQEIVSDMSREVGQVKARIITEKFLSLPFARDLLDYAVFSLFVYI